MKISRSKAAGALALGIAATLALGACSSSNTSSASDQSPAPTLAADKKVSITFAETMASGSLKPALDDLIKKFQQANPNITVNLEVQPNYANLKQKIDSMVSAGKPPTIAQVYPEWADSYLEAQVLQPLDGYAKDNSELNDFYKGVKSSLYIDNKLVTWPFNASNMVMYYNPDQLKKAGVGVPTTWSEFADTIKKTSVDGVTGISVDPGNSSSPANGTQMFQVIAADNGAELFTSDGKPQFTSDAAVSALQSMVDMKKAGSLATGSNYPGQTALGAQKGTFDVSTSTSYFYNKKAVGNKFTMGVAPLPAGPNGKSVNLLSGTSVALFKQADDDQKAAAWKFMQFLAAPENQAEWASKTGYLPVTKKALDEQVFKTYVSQNPWVATAGKALDDSVPLPPQSWVNEAQGLMAVAISDALSGSASPKDALAKAQTAAEKLVKK